MTEAIALLGADNKARHDNNGHYGTPSSGATISDVVGRGSGTRPIFARTNSEAAIAAAEKIKRESWSRQTAGGGGVSPTPFGVESTTLSSPLAAQKQQRGTAAALIIEAIRDLPSQLPAILIASALNLMAGIPFGASYFPTELEIPGGKQVLGLRMFLFSTLIAQLVFTYKSKFDNCVGLQMVENVPFYLELARIVIDEQGSSSSIVVTSTLFFLFGLSSLIVGTTFYLLGKLQLGRIVYFFPSHVLMGCISGIGVFITVTSLEVTTDTPFTFTAEGFESCIVQNIHLLAPVLVFEVTLRVLVRLTVDENGGAKFPMLCPAYYCCITPMFYAALWILGVSVGSAEEAGYFFPPLGDGSSSSSSSSSSGSGDDLLSIFTEVHFESISWNAVLKSIPTIISLAAFSLLHVPINVPAFAISTNVEPDMNAELIAHGYSNVLAGIFAGLQNYMAYAHSVIYSKSNGKGKVSSLAIVVITIMLFIYGPTMASYVPRCMAGTMLFHIGIDLFLEGVVESYHDFDRLEYGGVCFITVIMVVFGMDGGLVAGVIAALSTYAAQSIAYQDPIRGEISGARLRSSAWIRSNEAQEILLDNKTGRQRIFVIQFQGHVFFGNATKLTDDVKHSLNKKREADDEPVVVILDFTNVLNLDTSAAQSIAKLKSYILKKYDVEIVIFVTGHEYGFRCTHDLSDKIVKSGISPLGEVEHEPLKLKQKHRLSVTAERALRASNSNVESKSSLIAEIPDSRIASSLDEALVFAEDVLIALENPSLLHEDATTKRFPYVRKSSGSIDEVKSDLETLCLGASEDDINTLYNLLVPEKYKYGDIVWEQGDASTSMKLVVEGSLVSLLEAEKGVLERIGPGSAIGELGLVHGIHRLTTVKVLSEEAILYSLSKEKWETLTQSNPKVAQLIYMLVIRYLAHRVQYVSSNNILDGRNLPV